ncbi:MAG TPA: hypothetical protein VE825_12450 [Terriglobales bacterium]|nr:hypothetical protein [Terriglobales bacterium]
MARTPTWLHAILLWLVFAVVLFPISGLGFYAAAYLLGPHYMTRKVGYPPPDEFPVLVVTPASTEPRYQAEVIYFRNLEKFLKEHPDATYLVPQGWDGKLNDQLYATNRQGQQGGGKGPDFDVPFAQSFTVERLGDGRQRLHVDAPIDDDEPNQGWYEASAGSFTPLRYRHYITLGLSMGASFIAVPAAAVFSILLAVVLAWWVERRRLKRAPAAQSKAAGA